MARAPSATEPARPFGTILVRYAERSPIRVIGPATGQPYHFSAAAPVQPVAARDAEALLGTPYFHRA